MSWTSAYGHRARVFDVAFDHSGTRFATASEDSTARIWREVPSDAAQPGYEQEACLTGHGAEVLRVGWNHDGTMLATGAPHLGRLSAPATTQLCKQVACTLCKSRRSALQCVRALVHAASASIMCIIHSAEFCTHSNADDVRQASS